MENTANSAGNFKKNKIALKIHQDDINPPGLSRAGSPPSWWKVHLERGTQRVRKCLASSSCCSAIPVGCNSVNTPKSCQPGSLTSKTTAEEQGLEAGVSSGSTGWLWHGHGAVMGLCDLRGLFQPQFHGQNSSSCPCRELSMEWIPVEPPLGHCGLQGPRGEGSFPL